ncbi:hypothetical protein C8R47DRAFT_1217797 [Mycena vitilis]|nr:hypothetical protein C8R47DRAFT_1217797 [Mycena vitilis]
MGFILKLQNLLGLNRIAFKQHLQLGVALEAVHDPFLDRSSPFFALPYWPHSGMRCGADGSQLRVRVDQDPLYYPFVQKADVALTHLIGSTVAQTRILSILQTITCLDRSAKQALEATLGEARDLEDTDIQSYFLNKTPSIVITALEETPSKLVWGEVRMNDAEGAASNEISISAGLVSTLWTPPPSELSQSQIEEQRLYHELMISIILLRESVNALTKRFEFFTSDLVTPCWPGLDSDGQGGGAVGRTLE